MAVTIEKTNQLLSTLVGTVPVSGAVSGNGFSISVPLTVTNGAYSIGDVVGGLITLPAVVSAAGKRGVIYNVTLAGVSALAYHLWLMTADLAAGTVADNAAFALAAGDMPKVVGIVAITATDYAAAQSAFNVASVLKPREFSCVATTLYAYLVADATTTPGTTALTLTVSGEWID